LYVEIIILIKTLNDFAFIEIITCISIKITTSPTAHAVLLPRPQEKAFQQALCAALQDFKTLYLSLISTLFSVHLLTAFEPKSFSGIHYTIFRSTTLRAPDKLCIFFEINQQ